MFDMWSQIALRLSKMKILTSLCITFMRLHLERIPQVSVITGPNQWTFMNCLPFCSLLLTLEVLACISLSISNYKCLPIDKLWFILLSLMNMLKEGCMNVKLPQSCTTVCDPIDCSPPGSSIHEILQARILQWVAMPSSRESSWPRIEPTYLMSPALAGGFFTTSATSVQFTHSVVSYSLWPTDCSTPGFPVHHQLQELVQTHVHWVVMPCNHLIFCHTLLLLPSIFPSSRIFSNESILCIGWPE